jgi:hypothetical protein
MVAPTSDLALQEAGKLFKGNNVTGKPKKYVQFV